MFSTRRLLSIAVLLAAGYGLVMARPDGDASVAPPAPVARGLTPAAAGTAKSEAVFAARYAALYEQGLYPGLPVSVCEAKLLECRGLSYEACRETCREACGLR